MSATRPLGDNPRMFERQRSGSVLCPGCGSLVGVNDDVCLTCGRRKPGLFGFAALLRKTGEDMGFLTLVLGACGLLFVATLASSQEIGSGSFDFLSPDSYALIRFGGTGAFPVFRLGRWWTVLSYAWLHGGLVHIVFNMMAARDLIPATAHLYGAARTVILYTAAAIGGGALTSGLAHYEIGVPFLLPGSHLTIGASGSIFGLLGALAYYARRSGSRAIGELIGRWIVMGLAFGLVARADNSAHLGGLAVGYLLGRWLDPLLPERRA